ncbi:hypothetical protein FACS189434_09200 [Bacteroidia bacterium]|nr:hypothetical protein FACS189434_09200 [Bacteroidia bacterium]
MEHKQEIISTRTGGLGSSDAKMVAKIARNGCLNDADRHRIAIMLGLEEKREFSTVQTEYGNEIEARIFDIIKERYPNAVSNPYYKSDALSQKYGFDIFNHIDYEVETETSLIWIENKATKKPILDTLNDYQRQFEWHGLLLSEKAEKIGKEPVLFLSHYLVSDYDEIFDASKFQLIRSHQTYKQSMLLFKRGFEVISEAIENFEYKKPEELYAECLPEPLQDKLQAVAGYINQITDAEKQIDKFKETMLGLMLENNVKSIRNEFFKITLTGEGVTTTFDKKTFEKENPELAAMYQKQSKRKAFITIKTF